MSLVTRCPHCGTAFRVMPDQLSAKGGKVRCGKCAAVFDGVSRLLVDAGPALPEPPRQQGLAEPEPHAQPAVAVERLLPMSASTAQPLQAAVSGSAPGAASAYEPGAEPAFLAEPKPRSRFGAAWALLSVVAVGALLVQATLHFRTELGVLMPGLRPALSTACSLFGCVLGLPRRADLMSIESSELQARAQRDPVFVLSAVLRNRAPFPQELPCLELTLTDHGERPLARRVLMPADYVRDRSATEPIAQGIAAGAELVLRVPIEARRVAASGYRLYLFYP